MSSQTCEDGGACRVTADIVRRPAQAGRATVARAWRRRRRYRSVVGDGSSGDQGRLLPTSRSGAYRGEGRSYEALGRQDACRSGRITARTHKRGNRPTGTTTIPLRTR